MLKDLLVHVYLPVFYVNESYRFMLIKVNN